MVVQSQAGVAMFLHVAAFVLGLFPLRTEHDRGTDSICRSPFLPGLVECYRPQSVLANVEHGSARMVHPAFVSGDYSAPAAQPKGGSVGHVSAFGCLSRVCLHRRVPHGAPIHVCRHDYPGAAGEVVDQAGRNALRQLRDVDHVIHRAKLSPVAL